MALSCFISVLAVLLFQELLVLGQTGNGTTLSKSTALDFTITTPLSERIPPASDSSRSNDTIQKLPSTGYLTFICPEKPECATACSLININGCKVCQCPSVHPCVIIRNHLPLGCSQCIPIYSSNGCVKDCECTAWLRDQLEGFGNSLFRPFNGSSNK